MADARIGLYLMTAKGLAVLKGLTAEFGSDRFAYVVTARDAATEYDGSDEITAWAKERSLPVFLRGRDSDILPPADYILAVSWRWLIQASPGQQLVVFHDSLLPRYRGFAPLVNALINGEKQVGVTALFASAEYDRGPIIAQEVLDFNYPITIGGAIERIAVLYERLALHVTQQILSNSLQAKEQDEAIATYSLWRDEQDYLIDWTLDASRIRRFVDAVGYPYLGATTFVDGELLRVLECEEAADVMIENRDPGKVIFVIDGKPVVVCGQGLLRILSLKEANTGNDLLPLKKFRSRFHS